MYMTYVNLSVQSLFINEALSFIDSTMLKTASGHPYYAIYARINPRPNFLLAGEFWVHLPAGS